MSQDTTRLHATFIRETRVGYKQHMHQGTRRRCRYSTDYGTLHPTQHSLTHQHTTQNSKNLRDYIHPIPHYFFQLKLHITRKDQQSNDLTREMNSCSMQTLMPQLSHTTLRIQLATQVDLHAKTLHMYVRTSPRTSTVVSSSTCSASHICVRANTLPLTSKRGGCHQKHL